jgi:hypothetical protein
MAFSPEQTIIKLLLAEFAADFPTADRVGVDTPGDWAGRLPYGQVRNVGGTRDFNLRRPRLILTYWAADYGTAEDVAQRVDDYLHAELPRAVDGIVVALGGTTSSPAWQPYENPDVVRYAATYRFNMH